jgi:hypothetical protein
VWRFHEPQGAIPFHHLPHDIGQCEDEFRARKATSAYPPISSDFISQAGFVSSGRQERERTHLQSERVRRIPCPTAE